MTNKYRLLIVNSDQFGYHTDTYSYCRYLRGAFQITYVGWDYGFPAVSMEGVTVIGVSRRAGKIRRTLELIDAARRQIGSGHYDLVFVVYFRGCSLIARGCDARRMILDIRSGCVHALKIVRRIENAALRLESRVFPRITVIAESLRDSLRLPAARCFILPLGGEEWRVEKSGFGGLRLLYVGTLNFRNIEQTVEGFGRFRRLYGEAAEISYDIVGGGDDDVRGRLQEAIDRSGCSDVIRYHGKVAYPEIERFFDRATVGVAFVPEVEYFQCQPTTKVFEYLLAGMPVIATGTFENRRVVQDGNGILCKDSAEGFFRGLCSLYEQRARFDPMAIRAASKRFSWQSIVESVLRPYLESLIRGEGAKSSP